MGWLRGTYGAEEAHMGQIVHLWGCTYGAEGHLWGCTYRAEEALMGLGVHLWG